MRQMDKPTPLMARLSKAIAVKKAESIRKSIAYWRRRIRADD